MGSSKHEPGIVTVTVTQEQLSFRGPKLKPSPSGTAKAAETKAKAAVTKAAKPAREKNSQAPTQPAVLRM